MKFLVLLCSLLVATQAFAHSYGDQLDDLQKRIPPNKMRAYLLAWQKREPNNPDPSILLANWLLTPVSKFSLGGSQPHAGVYGLKTRGDDLVMVDPKGHESLLSGAGHPDPKAGREALELLKNTRDRFPCRLDIHLGVAYAADLLDLPDEQLEALKAMTRAARENIGKLCWERNAPLNQPEEETVMWNLHSLAIEQRDEGTKKGLARTLKISQLMVEEFPRQAVPWNDLGTYYMAIEDWPNAQKILEKALTIAPDDPVVLYNFGCMCCRLGMPDRAADAFRKVIASKQGGDWIAPSKKMLKQMGKSETSGEQR